MKLFDVLRLDTRVALLTIIITQLLCQFTTAAYRARWCTNCLTPIPAETRPVCQDSPEDLCDENALCGHDVCDPVRCWTNCRCTCGYGTACTRVKTTTYPRQIRFYISDQYIRMAHSAERRCKPKPLPHGVVLYQP